MENKLICIWYSLFFTLKVYWTYSSSYSTKTKQLPSYHPTRGPQSLQSIHPEMKTSQFDQNNPFTPASTVVKASRPGTTVAGCKSAGMLDWSTRVIFIPSWGQIV